MDGQLVAPFGYVPSAAICHKSWGSRPNSLPPSILLSFLPSRGLPGGLGRARSSAAKHFDAIYTVKQPYNIHIDFNVLSGTEISVHAEFSHCH